MFSRRHFVRDSGIVVGVMMFPGVLRARVGRVAPSDLVRVGVIGCNGMGFQDLRSILKIPEVECGALCTEGSMPIWLTSSSASRRGSSRSATPP